MIFRDEIIYVNLQSRLFPTALSCLNNVFQFILEKQSPKFYQNY